MTGFQTPEVPDSPGGHRPVRSDDVAAWLKRQRDGYPRLGLAWICLDDLLDLYRLHCDTGTPLSGEVSEHGQENG